MPIFNKQQSRFEMATAKKDAHSWTDEEVEALVRYVASYTRQAEAGKKRVIYADILKEFASAKDISFKSVENKWNHAKREFLAANVTLPSGSALPPTHPYYTEWMDALGGKTKVSGISISSPLPIGASAGMVMSASSQYTLSSQQESFECLPSVKIAKDWQHSLADNGMGNAYATAVLSQLAACFREIGELRTELEVQGKKLRRLRIRKSHHDNSSGDDKPAPLGDYP